MTWITETYTVHEHIVMKGVEPQQSAFAGERIYNAVFWNPMPNALDWYTSMSKREGLAMIRLKQVLIKCVTTVEISEKNVLPNKCNKKQAKTQGVTNIYDDDVCEIIEEVYRRETK